MVQQKELVNQNKTTQLIHMEESREEEEEDESSVFFLIGKLHTQVMALESITSPST
jgi:hypothetical protein